MPSTLLKNCAYRLLLSICAPRCPRMPLRKLSGHTLYKKNELIHLLKKHHVQGGGLLLGDDSETAIAFTASRFMSSPPEPDQFYRVASITKSAVSLLALHLSE